MKTRGNDPSPGGTPIGYHDAPSAMGSRPTVTRSIAIRLAA